MKEEIVKQKSFAFALWVVKLATYLQCEREVKLSTWAFGTICPEQSPKRIIHIQSHERGVFGIWYIPCPK